MGYEPEPARLHAHVRGVVQGVGFRCATLDTARRLGLAGWVRNDLDGSVEVLAEGERPALDALLGFLWRGPRSAEVADVTVAWLAAAGDIKGFTVRA
jgi:acylphosphatase